MSVKPPRLKRDWIGRYVKLNCSHETNGGVLFPPGTVMKVINYYRGLKLMLIKKCRRCKIGIRHISRVDEHDVELLPEDYQP